MQNPILQKMSGAISQSQNNIMIQAIGAWMRGESPQSFMKNLAKTNPVLQGLDLDNLDRTAEDLYSKNGKDINEAKNKISQFVSNFK